MWYGSALPIAGTWWKKSKCHRWIPLKKASYVKLWRFLCCQFEQAVEQTISCRRFETSWRSHDIIVMRTSQYKQCLSFSLSSQKIDNSQNGLYMSLYKSFVFNIRNLIFTLIAKWCDTQAHHTVFRNRSTTDTAPVSQERLPIAQVIIINSLWPSDAIWRHGP